METRSSKFLRKLKEMKSVDFIYLGVVFVFFVIVAVLFVNSTNFIIKNVNKIFSSESNKENQGLNMENYLLVAKKLNLPKNTPVENNTVNTTPQDTTIPPIETIPPTTTSPVVETPTPPAPIFDKKSITIDILNSTNKKGVASALAQVLENAGFSKATTGNEKKAYTLTTILAKEGKNEYIASLKEAVETIYPQTVLQIVPDKTDSDFTIIIGKQ